MTPDRNPIEALIHTREAQWRGAHATAPASLRGAVKRRRVLHRTGTGAVAGAAAMGMGVAAVNSGAIVGSLADAGVLPASWAEATQQWGANPNGTGTARVHTGAPQTSNPHRAGWECGAPAPAPTGVRDGVLITSASGKFVTEHQMELPSPVLPAGVAHNAGPGLDVRLGVESLDEVPTTARLSAPVVALVQDGVIQAILHTHGHAVNYVEIESDNPDTPSQDVVTTWVGGSSAVDVRALGAGSVPVHPQFAALTACGPWVGGQSEVLPAGEYEAYVLVRAVADDQAGAQRYLQEEGVLPDPEFGEVAVAARSGELLEVDFPDDYVQRFFDVTLVSEPFTVTVPDAVAVP